MAFFAALFAPLFATVKGMLGVLGFTSLGIKAGSLAAMIQSLIGNVVAKSLFAILQSAGMGGYGAAIAFQFAKDRPVSTACVSIGALAIAAPALAAGPALATFGFKTSGIASNSIAAGVQKGIGSIIAPSIFSTLQSAGAGGYGVAPVYGAIQGAGAALSVGGLSGFFEESKKPAIHLHLINVNPPQLVRETHVNLVDLTQSPQTGQLVKLFDTLEDLREYTLDTGKIFPKKEAYEGGLLKMLLREILTSRRQGLGPGAGAKG
ncbi:hypothetical protein NM208_g9220 [Fusarium decemcellulare]|uniref:Uncharacterized protein n=1 Tax=Fusarium decemcellulare TaxID=57161 RepID=A0ACC1S2D1_9HYPO|nr:hypothetical protein NM208_g9220 [Fusarium decemcellulare]